MENIKKTAGVIWISDQFPWWMRKPRCSVKAQYRSGIPDGIRGHDQSGEGAGPKALPDLIPTVALYRPGPLGSGMVDDFIAGRHGRKEPDYMHPLLEPILKETFGVVLYQEQVMQIVQVLAGFTLGQADLLRRAMGKKKHEILMAQKENFLKGCAGKRH